MIAAMAAMPLSAIIRRLVSQAFTFDPLNRLICRFHAPRQRET